MYDFCRFLFLKTLGLSYRVPPELPLPAFLLAVVDDGAGPAVEGADVGDVLLLGGGDGTVTASHLEIVLAAPYAFVLCFGRTIGYTQSFL